MIGAGAIAEVGLPTGGKLKEMMADSLDIEYDSIGNVSKGNKSIGKSIKEKCEEAESSVSSQEEMVAYEAIFGKVKNYFTYRHQLIILSTLIEMIKEIRCAGDWRFYKIFLHQKGRVAYILIIR